MQWLDNGWFRLKLWLWDEPTGFWKRTGQALLMPLIMLLWLYTVSNIISFAVHGPGRFSYWLYIPFALIEEIIFRWAPLSIFILLLGKQRLGLLLIVAVVSSILFGLAHDNAYNLPIQGVGGLIMSLFFIKNCSARRNSILRALQFSALAVTTMGHAFYNMAIEALLRWHS